MSILNRNGKGGPSLAIMVVVLMLGQVMLLPIPTSATREQAEERSGPGADGPCPDGPPATEGGSWVDLPDLNMARYDHTMHLLENNSVMVIGGTDGATALRSVEIYNPFIGEWGLGPSMNHGRAGHASVVLQNGSIMVIGGYDSAGDPISSAEVLSGNGNRWIDLPPLPYSGGWANITASPLMNGSVLVVGANSGPRSAPNVLARATIFDVINGTWSTVPAPPVAAMSPRAFLLLNWTVLVTGGSSGGPWYDGIPSTHLFDPSKSDWVELPDMARGRYMFDGMTLGSGDVMALGGIKRLGPGYDVRADVEVFNATSGTWRDGPSLKTHRFGHSAVLIPTKEIVITGGKNSTSIQNSTEIVKVVQNSTVNGPPMKVGRTRHASLRTSMDNVMVTGGIAANGATARTELFRPGVTEDEFVVEVFSEHRVGSEGELEISVHVYNDSIGDIEGVTVSFYTDDQGSFDPVWGLTDADGVFQTTFRAPANRGTSVTAQDIGIRADRAGYKVVERVHTVQIHPETMGKSEVFNRSIDHLGYVTVYGPGSGYEEDSHSHTYMDLVGDEVTSIDGRPMVVANISISGNGEIGFEDQDGNHHRSYETTGFRFHSYDLNGTVLSHINTTTREHIWNGTTDVWENTTVITEMEFLPARRWIDISAPVKGVLQQYVNTYVETTTTKDLDTGTRTTTSRLRTDSGSMLLSGWENHTSFLGRLEASVFVDETGFLERLYSTGYGVLLEETEHNETGELMRRKSLFELNELRGEDPTSPRLEVNITPERTYLTAGTSTVIRIRTGTAGEPVGDVALTLRSEDGGTLSRLYGTTDDNGWLNVTFSANRKMASTGVNVSITAEREGYRTGTGKVLIHVERDTNPPDIIHLVASRGQEGEAVPIHAFISDDIGISTARLHYRRGAYGEFDSLLMEEVLGAHEAEIPAEMVQAPLVQYYISAVDINGNRATHPPEGASAPYSIAVSYRERMLSPVHAVLTGGGGLSVTMSVRGQVAPVIKRIDSPDPLDARDIDLFALVDILGTGELVWANLTFSYRDPMVDRVSEDELMVYRWEETSSSWQLVDETGVLPDRNLVYANVTTLSAFAPRVLTPPEPRQEPDTYPPTVSILGPMNNDEVEGGLVNIFGLATDEGRGLTSVEVRLDGGSWITVWVDQGSKKTDWDLKLVVASGEHTISVRGVDLAGNVGEMVTISFTMEEEGEEIDERTKTGLLYMAGLLILLMLVIFAIEGREWLVEPTGPDLPADILESKDEGAEDEEEPPEDEEGRPEEEEPPEDEEGRPEEVEPPEDEEEKDPLEDILGDEEE